MHRVGLHYSLSPKGGPALLQNPLFELLQAVHETGSINGAAKALDLSYRHVWGELKKWESTLGRTLVTWEKGRPAQLTSFGAKLMWAERQAQARLLPQITALRADLDRVFAVAFDESAHILTFFASHDAALSSLSEHARNQRLHLDIRFTGSVDAIRALNEGRCAMAGFHARHDPAVGSLAQKAYKPLLRPGLHKLIGFTRRTQGLIVAPGNPMGLTTLADLPRKAARLSNRARGTGTRVLLDDLLAEHGIPGQSLKGYDSEEPSHAAVAEAVASGDADAGIGIEASARARGLDFVPLIEEHYYLACLKTSLTQEATRSLLAVLGSDAWQKRLSTLPGYTPDASGEVLSMSKVLPWWQFRQRKQTAPRPD